MKRAGGVYLLYRTLGGTWGAVGPGGDFDVLLDSRVPMRQGGTAPERRITAEIPGMNLFATCPAPTPARHSAERRKPRNCATELKAACCWSCTGASRRGVSAAARLAERRAVVVLNVYWESDPKNPVQVNSLDEAKRLIKKKYSEAVFGEWIPGTGVRILQAYEKRQAMDPKRIALIKELTVQD